MSQDTQGSSPWGRLPQGLVHPGETLELHKQSQLGRGMGVDGCHVQARWTGLQAASSLWLVAPALSDGWFSLAGPAGADMGGLTQEAEAGGV